MYGDDWEAQWRGKPVGVDSSLNPWSADIVRAALTCTEHFPKDPLPSYLAVGCGSAVAEYALKEMYNITLTDISTELIQRLTVQGWAHCQVEDAQKLSFSDNTFDAVVSEGLLEHFSDTTVVQQIVSELARVAKHFVIIVVPYSKSAVYQDFKASPLWCFGEEADFSTLIPYFSSVGLRCLLETDIGGEALSNVYNGRGRPYPYLMSVGRKL